MDINDVKALIKSLTVTSTVPYSVPKLVRDFEEQTGMRMPLYNFKNVRSFLKSLTDTVKFVGDPPHEKIIPVVSGKSQHISSLIKRQGRMRYCKDTFSQTHFFMPENPFKQNSPPVSGKNNSNKNSKTEVGDSNKSVISKIKSQKGSCNKTYDDFLFNEDEINSIHKLPDLDPELKLITPLKPKKCDNISEPVSSNSSESGVNEGVKNKLKNLMKKQTRGIWCCDLPGLYEDTYQFSLEFKDFGYRSLIDMVMELTDIFRCVRPDNGDWLLFDASKPPSTEEADIRSASQCTVPEHIQKNLLQLIESHCENGSKPGVYLDEVLVLYYKKFRMRLNLSKLGFPNMKSLLTKLDGHILRLEEEGHRYIIKPAVKQNVVKQGTAVFPITPEDDVFTELFLDDVVKRGENFPELKIENYFRVGKKIDVNVADVWSPHKFYVQLKEYEGEFFTLNGNLQSFYNRYANKYKMPDATIQPNQICVTQFKNGEGIDEWNRSMIVRITKSNEVLVKFVDYGNRVKVDVGKLRFMHRDFFNLPAQSFSAKLSFIEPPNASEWPVETCKKFLNLVTVPTVEFHVMSIDLETKKICGVIIAFNGNTGINVGMALVTEKMAVCNDMKQLQDFTAFRNKSTIKKNPPHEIKKEIPMKPTRRAKFNDVKPTKKNEKSWDEINGDNQEKDEIFKLNDTADEKIQVHDILDGLEIIPKQVAVKRNPPGQNVCITNVNLTRNTPTLGLERDVYALAFWVMTTNELVKKVAEINLDNGLQMALNLARNMSNMTEITFVDWK